MKEATINAYFGLTSALPYSDLFSGKYKLFYYDW